jgi:hypothetical protein
MKHKTVLFAVTYRQYTAVYNSFTTNFFWHWFIIFVYEPISASGATADNLDEDIDDNKPNNTASTVGSGDTGNTSNVVYLEKFLLH